LSKAFYNDDGNGDELKKSHGDEGMYGNSRILFRSVFDFILNRL